MARALGLRISSFSAATVLCASCANVDVRFGPDQIDSGLGYWKYGVGSKPIYSLHWIGDAVSVSDGYANAVIFTITASGCAGLNEARTQLLRELNGSVTALIAGPLTPLPDEILADAAFHRLVYHPQSHSESLELSGFENVSLQPWIKSAENLRQIVRECRDS
jgi:hypothetical protein